MVMSLNMNYEEFNRLFNLQSNPAYKNLGKTNCEIGFFVERNYPENIAFKPSLTKDGNVDDISIIYVKYKNFDTCAKSLDNYMPISIAIYKISNYLTKRSQSSYDYENNDCPTKESVKISQESPQPINLDWDNYFFDSKNNKFTCGNGKFFSGIELLELIYKKHCDSVHFIKGLPIRSKSKLIAALIKIIDIFASIIEFILRHIFARTLPSKGSYPDWHKGYAKEDLKRKSGHTLNLVFLKAEVPVLVSFSIIIITLFYLEGDKINKWPEKTNSTLYKIIVLPMIIFLLFQIWDGVLPKTLFYILNYSYMIKHYFIFNPAGKKNRKKKFN